MTNDRSERVNNIQQLLQPSPSCRFAYCPLVVLLQLQVENLGAQDGVIRSDVFGPAGAGEDELLFFLVGANEFAGLDDECRWA